MKQILRLTGPFVAKPWRGILLAALLPLVIRLCLLPVLPIPLPRIHDEFSYLLAADTFAHGRVTNPTHQLWPFFESFHILQRPSYMSKYPPAQGLLLAAGEVLFGHPWWGVFLSVGLMCGVTCWMLQAWLPPRWALLGSLAVGLEFGVTHYWMNSYWGGASAAIGAGLFFGSYARLRQFRCIRGNRVLWALLLALGAGILLNSRPWEGMLIAIPVVIGFIRWLFQAQFRQRFVSVALPCAALLALIAVSMSYYCWRITGNPTQLPYVAVHKTYSVVPLFVWQKSTPAPKYHHAVMKRFYTEWETHYQSVDQLKTWSGWKNIELTRLRMEKDTLFGNFFLLLCAATLFYFWRKPSERLLLFSLAIFTAGLALEGWCQIHYFAPVVGLATVLKMSSLRRLSTVRFQGRKVGAVLALVVIAVGAVSICRRIRPERQAAFPLQRASVERTLEAEPGSHVVLVRYSPSHNPIQEWVYNKADIDSSRVIWAREMSPQDNQRLLQYYKGRHFWLIQPDVSPVRPEPLDGLTLETSEVRSRTNP